MVTVLVLAHSQTSQTQDSVADAAAELFGAIYLLSPVQEEGVFAERRKLMLDRLSFLSHKLPVHIIGVCALVCAAMLSRVQPASPLSRYRPHTTGPPHAT